MRILPERHRECLREFGVAYREVLGEVFSTRMTCSDWGAVAACITVALAITGLLFAIGVVCGVVFS